MIKFALIAAIAIGTFFTAPAFAGSNVNVMMNVRGGTQGYGARGIEDEDLVCAEGLKPAGRLGCMGEPITNRADLEQFDRPGAIKRRCVEGATRVQQVDGVDPNGRPVHWEIKQHAECNRNHRQ